MKGWRVASLPQAFLLAVACSGSPEVTRLPDPPAPLTQPEEYEFGTETHMEDLEALRAANAVVADAVPDLEGKPHFRYWTAPGGTDPAGMREWYGQRAAAGGWVPIEGFQRNLSRGSDGFAFSAPGRAFALIWLKQPVGAEGERSVTVIRYGAER